MIFIYGRDWYMIYFFNNLDKNLNNSPFKNENNNIVTKKKKRKKKRKETNENIDDSHDKNLDTSKTKVKNTTTKKKQ